MVKIIIYAIYLYDRYIRHRLRILYGRAYLKYFKGIHDSVLIHGKITVWSKANFKIGKYSRIGQNFFADARGSIKIGDNVQISRNVIIYSTNHEYNSLNAIPYDDKLRKKEVIIEDSVWIGMNAMILPGVKVGKGSIIGMGTIVYKDIPPYSIVVNSSMTIINKRDKYSFDKLESEGKLFGKIYPNK